MVSLYIFILIAMCSAKYVIKRTFFFLTILNHNAVEGLQGKANSQMLEWRFINTFHALNMVNLFFVNILKYNRSTHYPSFWLKKSNLWNYITA